MSEHLHQKALFEWADRMEGAWPELRLMYAIPNGGLRTKAQAGKLKAEGVKPGVPDIHLPVAVCGDEVRRRQCVARAARVACVAEAAGPRGRNVLVLG